MKLLIGKWTLTIKLENAKSSLNRRLQQLVAGGLKIQAIKEYRAATSSSLKDAVIFVELLPKIPSFAAMPKGD